VQKVKNFYVLNFILKELPWSCQWN